jgi:SAM-dependent methyltransferase
LDNYKQLIKNHILDEATFIRAVFSGRQRGHVVPWDRVIVRPVLVKNKRHIQISQFDSKKDITKNYTAAQIAEKLDELLDVPFKSVQVQTGDENFQIQITKKGKAILHRHKAPKQQKMPSLRHDRRKNLLLPGDKPDPFLQKIGIMTKEGKVRADKQGKFRQINEFLRLLIEAGELEKIDQSPLNIVDCGCGSAYLTFAVYHYLNHVLDLPTRMIGIDVNKDLLARRTKQSQDLGWQDLSFQATSIIDFQPTARPNIVLALHACDTATDEALAQGVKWQSDMIFSAPCCHHHLQQQMNLQTSPSLFAPIMRHGALKERLGDIVTDSFRALILQIMGYRTNVAEFVSTEHTGKNLLLRSIRTTQPGNNQRAIQEYQALKDFWQVEPYLEKLLERELSGLIST